MNKFKSQDSLTLSDPLLSGKISDYKSRDGEFFDCSDNPPSIFQSFEQISKSVIFKSFSDDKQTISNSDKNNQSITKNVNCQKYLLNDKKKKNVLKSISDGDENSKSSRFKHINENVFKNMIEIYENNFEEPNTLEKNQKDENLNIIMINTPRLDLTNRFINLLSQNFYFRSIYFIVTLVNIAFRIYLMSYFYDIYKRGFEMGSLYLCFFYIPRICYMLSMWKILFHVDEEEIYIERLSKAFNSFDEISVKSWNEQFRYDYEINMNDFFGRKKNLVKKWKKKPFIVDYKTTLKAFFKRIIIVLIPVEITLIFFKVIYRKNKNDNKSFIKLFLIANWIYQCYECLLLLPCIFCLYYLEYEFNLYWRPGNNDDSFSFLMQSWEVLQFFILNIALSLFNFENAEKGPYEFHNF